MIETWAVVVEVHGETALVRTDDNPVCSRCAGTGGCGAANFTRLFCARRRAFTVGNPTGAQAGERVVVGIAEDALLRSSATVYLAPLLLIIAGASAGVWLAPDVAARDLYSIVGGLAGLASSVAAIKALNARKLGDPAFRPTILRSGGPPSVRQ